MNADTQTRREAIIIGVLNAHGGFPVSTRTVRDCAARVSHPTDNLQWLPFTLHQLAGRGEIERWHIRGSRSYYWRR